MIRSSTRYRIQQRVADWQQMGGNLIGANSWDNTNLYFYDYEEAVEALDKAVKAHPDDEFRIVKCVTTEEVVG